MNGRSRDAPLARAASIAALCAFGIVCTAGLWRIMATIGLHVPFDPNEGWNAYHSVAAMSGRPLYPAPPGDMVNNYPPLSFYIVGTIGRFLGDDIFAGRIVSLLSFCAICAVIYRASRRMGCRIADAALAALLFMSCLILGSDYAGMDDPQLLGHAIAMVGFLFLLRERPGAATSAALFALAVFVKHNLVALPLAAAMWLAIYDRRAALRYGATCVSTLAFGLALFRLIYGTNLLAHLMSARTYSLPLMTASVFAWLAWSWFPLTVAAVLVAMRRRNPHVVLCALYAAVAVAIGIVFAGGAGVDVNVFFDADIALALTCGAALARAGECGPHWRAGMAFGLLLPLAAGLYNAYDPDWHDGAYWLHPMADDAETAQSDIEFLKAHPGPALCETLALCYWAGKSAQVDVFNAGQEFVTGARSDKGLAAAIAGRAFSVIEFDTLAPFALTGRIRAALAASYRVDRRDDDGVFFVPR